MDGAEVGSDPIEVEATRTIKDGPPRVESERQVQVLPEPGQGLASGPGIVSAVELGGRVPHTDSQTNPSENVKQATYMRWFATSAIFSQPCSLTQQFLSQPSTTLVGRELRHSTWISR